MKHSEKMVQIRESRLCGDIDDREPCCLQELLGVAYSDAQYFVKHSAPEFKAKRPF
jgi:hypothetical protein